MLLGRLFVGTKMGLGPLVIALYVAEVSPPVVQGAFGGLTQIAACLGLIGIVITLHVKLYKGSEADYSNMCYIVSLLQSSSRSVTSRRLLAIGFIFSDRDVLCVERKIEA
ncbi:hypothetical protein Fmac_020559 [Flemingia macrophylla]|uniref:Major facilitator superfamily (MFS) profile domain-containing protein n=1 Tax=Flemingia macrophylla TaxID=520843 RepID=A0ABD1LUB8_9FABA